MVNTESAIVEPVGGSGAGEDRGYMNDEARAPGGLDLACNAALPARVRGSPPTFSHEQTQRGGTRARPTYAALDLGTNNCRLLIARPAGEGFRVVDAFSRIIRLGEGVSISGRISEAAIERATSALGICGEKMRQRAVSRARLIATEACRAAENGQEFCARIRAKIGIDLEVVDRETEAALAAAGCTPLIDPQADGVILFDIGGGSSELVRLGKPQRNGAGPPKPTILGWASLPLGVVTLAERHGGTLVTSTTFQAMVDEVGQELADFTAAYGGDLGNFHLLGTSGTVTTIAGVHLELPRYDRRKVDGCWLSEDQVTTIIDRLRHMSYDQRVASPCIGVERADLVLAGCAILEAIRRAFPCRRLRVADRGLREGMLVQMMRADGVWDRARPWGGAS